MATKPDSTAAALDDFYGQQAGLTSGFKVEVTVEARPLTFGRVVLAVIAGNLITSVIVGVAYYMLTH